MFFAFTRFKFTPRIQPLELGGGEETNDRDALGADGMSPQPQPADSCLSALSIQVSAPSPATGRAVTRSLRAPTSWPATTGRTRGRSASPARSAPSASPAATTLPSTHAATLASAQNCSDAQAPAVPHPATPCPAAWLAAQHPAQHPAQPLPACRAHPAHSDLTPPRAPATCLLSRHPSSVPLRAPMPLAPSRKPGGGLRLDWGQLDLVDMPPTMGGWGPCL